MRLIHGCLLCLLVIAAMVIWIGFTGVAEPIGGPHPVIPHMSVGGDGATRASPILLPIYIWQVAVLILAGLMLTMGFTKRKRSRSILIWIWGAIAATIAAWTMLVFTYGAVIESGVTGYFGGFPVSTAWMLYGLYFAQAILVVFYVMGFHKYIYTDNDKAKFEQILERKKIKFGEAP